MESMDMQLYSSNNTLKKISSSASYVPGFQNISDTKMDASILKIKETYPTISLLVDTKSEKFPQKVRKLNII